MHTRLKICGITHAEDARRVTELGVDILGFNFYPGSPRYVAPREAARIIATLPPTVTTVGILVNPTLEEAIGVLHLSQVNWLQLYLEPPHFPLEALDVPIIYCRRIGNGPADFSLPEGADFLLLDAYHPQHLGGTGVAFNWDQIPPSLPRERLILAGGIRPENIQEALHRVRPAIVDVASGAEQAPGHKDPAKVSALQQAVLQFNLHLLETQFVQQKDGTP